MDQKLVCSIQFQSIEVFFDHLNGMIKARMENNGVMASSCCRKFVREIFTSTDSFKQILISLTSLMGVSN
jgi:hypothetical protein